MHRLLATLRSSTLAQGSPAHRPGGHAPGAAELEPEAVPPEDGDPPGACGWFDSSHALQHGLCVTEHASADAVSAQLPLADWLQLHLSGWTAAPLASSSGVAMPTPH